MSRSGHIAELDGVRGIACVSVLLAHCLVGPAELASTGSGVVEAWRNVRSMLMPILLGGVDLFFVLSGFLIGGILMDNRSSPNYFTAFYVRRAARILPVLFALVASYAVALTLHQHFSFSAWDLWLMQEPRPPIWSYATFLQNFFIANTGIPQPRWMGITWSLAIEEQFYLLFPLAVYLIGSRRVLVWLSIAGVSVAMALRPALETYFGNWYAPYIMLPTRMDSLLLGFLVAATVRNAQALSLAKRGRYLIDGAILVSGFLITTNHSLLKLWPVPVETGGPFPPLKHTVLALMYALIILRIFLHPAGWMNSALRNKTLGWFGLISYALYMYHQAVNGVTHAALFGAEPQVLSSAQFFASLAVMAISTGLAWLSFKYMEHPIRRLGARVTYIGSRPALTPTRPV